MTFTEDRVNQASAAIADGDYGRALALHEEILDYLCDRDQAQTDAFSNGPYRDLILEAFEHIAVLVSRQHFVSALDLIRELRPRLDASGAQNYLDALDEAEAISQQQVLWTRTSPRAHDVVVCCTQATADSLAAPLIEDLAEIGVVVDPSPAVSSPDVSFEERQLTSDFVVTIVSRDALEDGSLLEEIHRLCDGPQAEAGRVIPVWHGVSRTDVADASPALDKILAFDTQQLDRPRLAREIADLVRPDLGSGALHKAIWSSILAGEPLSQAFSAFDLPVRHEHLDDDLIARIRLIRSAFLDGNRQMMRAWVDGFTRELEPYSAVVEWQQIARVFQEARNLQKAIATAEDRPAFVEQLLPPDDPESRELMRSALEELERLPSDRLAMLVWAVSQPLIVNNLDLGFPGHLIALTLMINASTQPMVDVDDDFIAAAEAESDLEITVTDEQAEDWDEAVLQDGRERPWSKQWDVFISHASEDKERLVRPLAEALGEHGVKVWYDAFTLKPGASLRQSIDAGIDGAEFGIFVISPQFVAKEWPRYEFEALQTRQVESDRRLLALWHGLSREDGPPWVGGLDASADLSAGTESITELAREVLGLIRPDLARTVRARQHHQALLDRPDEQIAQKKMNLSEMKPADRRHDRLPERLVERIRLIRAMLFDGYPHSMDFWLDGFLRDHNPEREVEHWERIAAMYGEAMLVLSAMQPTDGGRLRRLFGRRQRPQTVAPADVFGMLMLVDWPEQLLPKFADQYPEDVLNVVLNIISSPTVIDVLDPE